MRKLILVLFFSAIALNVCADGLELKGEMTQGSLIRGQVPVGHQVGNGDQKVR